MPHIARWCRSSASSTERVGGLVGVGCWMLMNGGIDTDISPLVLLALDQESKREVERERKSYLVVLLFEPWTCPGSDLSGRLSFEALQ